VKIQNHKELRVWQDAMAPAMMIFEVTKTFPAEERYPLTDQVRRSSRSVAANLSEAWRKRKYRAAFIAKLTDAEAEAAETQTWIELALRCCYLSAEQADELAEWYDRVIGQIVIMSRDADKWVPANGGDSR